MPKLKPCMAAGCEALAGGPSSARGMCPTHYQRWRRGGDPNRKRGEVIDGRRVCPGCKVNKSLAEYGKHQGTQTGLRARCRECERLKTRERRERNPEYVQPAWGDQNFRDASRRWRQRNPDKVRSATAMRRARRAVATVEVFSVAEIFDRDGWVCHICDQEIDQGLKYPDPMSASLDHVIPLSKGGEHSRENCRASHLTCNVRKHARMEVAGGAHCSGWSRC